MCWSLSFQRCRLKTKYILYILFKQLNALIVCYLSLLFLIQAHEFLLYSGLMLADTLLLAYFSVVYKSKNANRTDAMKPNVNKVEEITVID